MPTRPAARRAAPKPSKRSSATRQILAKLFAQYPNANTELNFTTPYELLVATILSAQCTDERVNQVTPALFKRYPDAHALARASTGELEAQIQSTGFFRAKSRALLGMASALVEQHRGAVPNVMDALVQLPGVGRKTANVVLGHALGVPALPVDRHVLRVANRIGIAASEEPDVVERQLCAAMPPDEWTVTSDTLILHGRRICKPRPLCERCAVRDDCDYYGSTLGLVRPKASARGRRPPASAKETTPGSIAPAARAAANARGTHVAGSGPASAARRAPKTPRTNPGPSGEQSEPEGGAPPVTRRAVARRGTGRRAVRSGKQ